jgi:hypothetical protein
MELGEAEIPRKVKWKVHPYTSWWLVSGDCYLFLSVVAGRIYMDICCCYHYVWYNHMERCMAGYITEWVDAVHSDVVAHVVLQSCTFGNVQEWVNKRLIFSYKNVAHDTRPLFIVYFLFSLLQHFENANHIHIHIDTTFCSQPACGFRNKTRKKQVADFNSIL